MKFKRWIAVALGLLLAAMVFGLIKLCTPERARHLSRKAAFAPFIHFGPDRIDYEYFSGSGERHGVAQDRGRLVCLYFWSTWCQPGRDLLPWLAGLAQQYQPCGLTVVAFAMDQDSQAVEKFLEEHRLNLTCPLLSPTLLTGSKNVEGLPTLFLIDRQGKIFKKYEGLNVHDRLEDDILGLLQRKE
jgi:thiol-disulfide isomerase/thioredoxin